MSGLVVEVLVGAAAGAIGGVASGRLVSRFRGETSIVPTRIGRDHPIDPEEAVQVDEDARRWADASGMPDAALLIARKMRLHRLLSARRERGQW